MTRTLCIIPILALAGCAGPVKGQPVDQVTRERISGLEAEVVRLGNQLTALAISWENRDLETLTDSVDAMKADVSEVVTKQEGLTTQLETNRAEARQDSIESREMGNRTSAGIFGGGVGAVFIAFLIGLKVGKGKDVEIADVTGATT